MDNLLLMMAPLFSSKLLLVLFFGTLFGLILGVLPGLGPTTGGALILPFTMTLDPLSAIVLLTSIYCAGTYGGAITAVLINTPGTPAAAATCLDGYPLAQKGEAGRALGMAGFLFAPNYLPKAWSAALAASEPPLHCCVACFECWLR